MIQGLERVENCRTHQVHERNWVFRWFSCLVLGDVEWAHSMTGSGFMKFEGGLVKRSPLERASISWWMWMQTETRGPKTPFTGPNEVQPWNSLNGHLFLPKFHIEITADWSTACPSGLDSSRPACSRGRSRGWGDGERALCCKCM